MSGSEFVVSAVLTIITAATPLVYAALGELIVEKSGVLNLGVEGMMIVGAVSSFAIGVTTESALSAILCGAISGALISGIFGFLVLIMMANQVATGLALTIFGLGLSALFGHEFVGMAYTGLERVNIPFLSQIPIAGPIIFGQDIMVYGSVFLTVIIFWFLTRTRLGLTLRAVGENHEAAHAIGLSVVKVRFMAILFGGAMAGLGGAYLSLVYTPLWVENMTAGRGWIALALVVFSSWRPWRAFMGAYLFGGIAILQLHLQGVGFAISPQLLSMLPYLVTIVVLVLISNGSLRYHLRAPGSLGKSFYSPS